MVSVLTIISALVLLVVIIGWLHRQQVLAMRLSADRSMPLPPLGKSMVNSTNAGQLSRAALLPGQGLTDLTGISGQPSTTPAQHQACPPVTGFNELDSVADLQQEQPACVDFDTSAAVSRVAQSGDPADSDNWLKVVNRLKREQRYDEALALAKSNFPLWSAYNQACILLRKKLKDGQESQTLNESDFQAVLQELYRTAVIAEFLHDNESHSERLELRQLRRIDLSSLESLETPFTELGYSRLRLLRKFEIKLMREHWGRPHKQQLPRRYYSAIWEQKASGAKRSAANSK